MIEWLDCAVIEQIPGKVSGQPVIRHSRVRPEDLLNNAELTEAELADEFGLPLEDVREVLAFFQRYQEPLAHSS